ncbi:hypothetical protein [Bacillus sp. MRMR6]|uniref:hypothetical protein n=1 Tax=Bacillus sp. MRMR6 TaxID=1928617 RepID=UPI000951E85D|nr:hypothetical protein [Bacillus sp. MRMR6]OLS39916.1 hypothetical protein BTR25_11915 [Bacillus sp. MRMR6]
MNLFRKKDESSEETQVKIVAYTIILYISSLFVPFVVVATYQSMFLMSRSQWFFTTPFTSYIGFMIGMLYIAVVLTVYLILRQKTEAKKLKWITVVLVLLSIPVFVFSLVNYYYLDEKGIHYNSLTSIKEEHFGWEDVTTLHQVYRNHQGTTGYYQVKFEMKDGRMITIPYDDKLRENSRRIEEKVNEYNIVVKDNYENPVID